eukprot:2603456-Pleurochrysis_carterae.AAC.2
MLLRHESEAKSAVREASDAAAQKVHDADMRESEKKIEAAIGEARRRRAHVQPLGRPDTHAPTFHSPPPLRSWTTAPFLGRRWSLGDCPTVHAPRTHVGPRSVCRPHPRTGARTHAELACTHGTHIRAGARAPPHPHTHTR